MTGSPTVTSRAKCAALLKPRPLAIPLIETPEVTSRAKCAALLKPLSAWAVSLSRRRPCHQPRQVRGPIETGGNVSAA